MNASHSSDSLPSRGDLAAIAMILLSLLALGGTVNRWGLIIPTILLAGFYPYLGSCICIRLGFIGHLLLALPFAILSHYWKLEEFKYVHFPIGFYLSLYLEAVALVRLYGPKTAERLPMILFTTSLVLATAGLVMPRRIFLVYLSLYVVAMAWLLRDSIAARIPHPTLQSRRTIAIVTVFNCSVILAILVTFLGQRYSESLARAYLDFLRFAPFPSAAGFDTVSRLSDISSLRNDATRMEIAIRAFASRPPGYLRGRVFWIYRSGEWQMSNLSQDVPLKREGENGTLGRFVFPGRPSPAEYEDPVMTIYPSSAYRAHFFLPLQASAVDSAGELVRLFMGNILLQPYTSTANGYFVYLHPAPIIEMKVQEEAVPLTPEEMAKIYLATPPRASRLMRTVKALRDRLGIRPGVDPPERVVANIASYFGEHFTYELGVPLDPGEDPVWQFLARLQRGHCELFASAGVLLLRSAGIPARYVTGFVCEEKNPYGNLYVARKKDAHAWVEYWTPSEGWKIAEFTPANGLPSPPEEEKWRGLFEYLHALVVKGVGFFFREGIGGVLALLLQGIAEGGRWILQAWWRILLALILMGMALYYRIGRIRRQRKRRLIRIFPEDVARLRTKYLEMETKLRRKGLGRRDAETLEEYMVRLQALDFPEREEALRLVRTFADIRYSRWGDANTEARERCPLSRLQDR